MFAGLMTAFLLSPAFGQLPSRGPSPEMKRACTVSLEPRAPKLRVIRPAPSDAILFNPGMGLYLAGNERMYTKPPADAWCLSIADIVYYRFFWSDLEPDGPRDSYDEFFAPIFDFWVKQRGKRVAFRVMSEASHFPGMYCTPKWVFDQGVPGVEHRGVHGQRQIDPVFWDERYLRIYGQFVERLGRYLDGRPGVEWVEIGGIGEWGEMHSGPAHSRAVDHRAVGADRLHAGKIHSGLSARHRRPRTGVSPDTRFLECRQVRSDQRLRRLARSSVGAPLLDTHR